MIKRLVAPQIAIQMKTPKRRELLKILTYRNVLTETNKHNILPILDMLNSKNILGNDINMIINNINNGSYQDLTQVFKKDVTSNRVVPLVRIRKFALEVKNLTKIRSYSSKLIKTKEIREDRKYRELYSKFIKIDENYDYNIGDIIDLSNEYSDKFEEVKEKMTKNSLNSLNIKNAGGNSEISEALSIDLLEKLYKAKNIVYEKSIEYWCEFKLLDYICEINNEKVGVSVTRAIDKYWFYEDEVEYKKFDEFDAFCLLHKKISGLLISSKSTSIVLNKLILHIWCQTEKIASIISKVNIINLYSMFDDNISKLNIILTICNKNYIYSNI